METSSKAHPTLSQLLTQGCVWRSALGLFGKMSEGVLKPDVYSFNAPLNAYEKVGVWRGMLALQKEMRQSILEPHAISLGFVMRPYVKGSAWARVFSFFEEIREEVLKPGEASLNAALSACEGLCLEKRA